MHSSHNTQVLHGSLRGWKLRPQNCVSLLELREGEHNFAAPHMQLEIFWVTPHTAWSPSLLDLFSTSILHLLQYTTLSVDPCGSFHACSMSQLLVTVR